MTRTQTTTYKFKRGQLVSLDQIYTIQGLAGGDWWDKVDDGISQRTKNRQLELDLSEECVITRNIEITITVKAA